MIIFGRGKQFNKTFGPVEEIHCDHCNNDNFFWLERTSTWFTLFFIPVIPYDFTYFLYCPICKHGYNLISSKAKELIPLAKINYDLVQGKINHEAYQQKLGEIGYIEEEQIVKEKKTRKKK